MGKIFISWATSPLANCLIAFCFESLLLRFLFKGNKSAKYKGNCRILPFLAALVCAAAAVFAFFIGGSKIWACRCSSRCFPTSLSSVQLSFPCWPKPLPENSTLTQTLYGIRVGGIRRALWIYEWSPRILWSQALRIWGPGRLKEENANLPCSSHYKTSAEFQSALQSPRAVKTFLGVPQDSAQHPGRCSPHKMPCPCP